MAMPVSRTALGATLLLAACLATSFAPLAEARGGLPPCPPRERGVPKPDDCYDPCPRDMVGEQPNCSCPPGTKKVERPEKPGQHCVEVKSEPSTIEQNSKLKNLFKACAAPKIGTFPDCHCPPGTFEPDCKPPILIPQQLPKRQY
jgi:hypothetical protein